MRVLLIFVFIIILIFLIIVSREHFSDLEWQGDVDYNQNEINFHKEKKNPPNFEYHFIYKNCEEFKVKIKSNFNSFRNGLISLRDIILSGDFYREPNEYKSFLKIYEAIKHE